MKTSLSCGRQCEAYSKYELIDILQELGFKLFSNVASIKHIVYRVSIVSLNERSLSMATMAFEENSCITTLDI